MRRLTLALLLLSGCQNSVQTSSGADYRAARPNFDARDSNAMDQAVARAAEIDPLLRFPARFGLARISMGQLTAVPPREADSWIAFAQAHGDLGSFEPINPLIAEMTASTSGNVAQSVVDRIRLGAARQHLDVVLVYSVAGRSKDAASVLSLLDLTIVGAYLVPSRSVRGDAVATALLIDVRNGYPYGTATAAAQAGGFVPSVGSGAQSQALAEDAEVAAVGKLTGEVDAMVGKLRTGLEEKELAALRAAQTGPARAGRS